MNPQPKPRTPRDSGFLAYLRTLPCVVCATEYTGQAHHTASSGISLVGSDYSAVPICTDCHRVIHQHTGKRGKWTPEELEAITAGYLDQYRESVKGNKKALEKIEEQLRGAW